MSFGQHFQFNSFISYFVLGSIHATLNIIALILLGKHPPLHMLLIDAFFSYSQEISYY